MVTRHQAAMTALALARNQYVKGDPIILLELFSFELSYLLSTPVPVELLGEQMLLQLVAIWRVQCHSLTANDGEESY